MNLRVRITCAALLGVFLVAIALGVTLHIVSTSWLDRYADSSIQSNRVLFSSIVSAQKDSMEAETQAITRDRKVRKLVASSNEGALLTEASPSFRRLSASGVLDKQQLFDVTGKLLFSLPEDRPNKVGEKLVSQVLTEGKVLRAIERDGDQLSIALAFPLLKRGKVIGAGLFLKDMDDALFKLKQFNDSELSIMDPDWQLENSTAPDFFKNLNIKPENPDLSSYIEPSFDGKNYSIVVTPIVNFSSNTVGYLVQSQDQTKKISETVYIKTAGYTIGFVILILIGIFLLWFIKLSFNPINKVVSVVDEVAGGNLSIKFDDAADNEIGKMMSSVAHMVQQLSNIIARLLPIANQLQTSCESLQKTAKETSDGVEVQIVENDQIAIAIEQMKSMSQEVANHSSKTAENAGRADDDTKKVQEIVNVSINSILSLNERIENSSRIITKLKVEANQIGSVLDVIRGIAEQTNLLALNAAIEAARAGEQGRGFAVVADEVRSLAGRTQQSTADINQMIQVLQSETDEAVNSMNLSTVQVQQSVEAITELGEALELVSQSISEMNKMNASIANAAEKQYLLVDDINRHVLKAVGVTNDNKRHIVATSKVSDQLNDLASELSALSAQFKI